MDIGKSKIDRINEFLKATFLIDEDELKALDKQIPMTQKLFDQLCGRLTEIGADELFLKLISDYPDLLRDSVNRMEKELGISKEDITLWFGKES